MTTKSERKTTFESYDYSEIFYGETLFPDYLESQLSAWKWIENSDEFLAGKEFFNTFIEANILQAEALYKRDGIADRKIKIPSYISSNGPTADFIQKVQKNHGNKVALFALIYSHPDHEAIIKNNKNIKIAIAENSNSYERELALFLTFTSNKSANFINNDATRELHNVISDFKRAAEISLSTIENSKVEAQNNLENIHQNNHKLQLRRARRYRKVFNTLKKSNNEKLEAAKNDLKSAAKAYHETVDFQASVKYWSDIESKCSKRKRTWLFFTTACIAIIFTSLITYYHFGGLSGKANLQQITALKENPNQEATSSTNKNITPDVLHSVTDLTGAALLIALLSVLLRISLRQFNIYTHLAQDASEKITMTKTYLALLNEGKLNSEQDRRLVLESLFRPSQIASLADPSSSTPIELVIKAITEKR